MSLVFQTSPDHRAIAVQESPLTESGILSRARDNQAWINALSQPCPQRDAALQDLHAILVRGLGYALADRPNLRESDLEDFAQDAILRILNGLHTFRGESRFTTWAHKIAVRVAFTELRRRRWQDVSLDELTESRESSAEFIPDFLADPSLGPEQAAMQQAVLTTLRHLIGAELSDRQRQALQAAMRGMPLEEIARRMSTNRNALYKLLHDARRRLQQGFLNQGLSPEDALSAFEP